MGFWVLELNRIESNRLIYGTESNRIVFFFPESPIAIPYPSSLLPFLSLPLEVGPWNPARGSGSAVSSPVGSGVESQPKLNLLHFSLKIWHLVATILIIFQGINWPNFVYFKNKGKSGPKFLSVSSSHEPMSPVVRFLVLQDFGTLRMSLLKHNHSLILKQRHSLPLNAVKGTGKSEVL